jgi:Sec-independent protein secretion pathway component TatC
LGIAIAILALLVVGALIGTALNFGSLFLGIPLVFLFIGAIVGKETMERQQRILRMKRFRREARAQKIEFEPTDKRTLV